MITLVSLALLSSLLFQGTLGEVTCEQLNKEACAFAVSSIGKRCVLEKYVRRSGLEAYKCTTSAIDTNELKDMVESNHCIEACGLDRDTLGISSDSLLESRFTRKLCSPQCYQNCPNVIDLYFNLAAGEGVFLPKLCESQSQNPRRGLSEIKSSGIAAPGPMSGVQTAQFLGAPISSLELADAPIVSPMTSMDLEIDIFAPPADTPASDAPCADAPAAAPAADVPVAAPAADAPCADAPADAPTADAPAADAPSAAAAAPADAPAVAAPADAPAADAPCADAPADAPAIAAPADAPADAPAAAAPAMPPC